MRLLFDDSCKVKQLKTQQFLKELGIIVLGVVYFVRYKLRIYTVKRKQTNAFNFFTGLPTSKKFFYELIALQ